MDVAIVILNWNGRKMLEKYLPAVYSSAERFSRERGDDSAFVVVADNGSSDGSTEYIKEAFPQVKVIALDSNYGFTGGYNRALDRVDADYYILLNDDVAVEDGWIDPLFDFMEENPDAGVCQPKILSDVDRGRFEYAGACGGFIDRYGFPFCRGRVLWHIEEDRGQYDDPMEVFWATGACMMVRSSLYHHLGGLDGSFFAHMEEIDFCWRAKLLGYSVWCIPQSAVYHFGGGTLSSDSPYKLYLNYRNNLLMLHKNLPESIRFNRIFKRMWIDRASAAVYLLQGKWSSCAAVSKAHRDFRRMKKAVELSPFEGECNNIGYWPHSIITAFYKAGRKLKFSDLDI